MRIMQMIARARARKAGLVTDESDDERHGYSEAEWEAWVSEQLDLTSKWLEAGASKNVLSRRLHDSATRRHRHPSP